MEFLPVWAIWGVVSLKLGGLKGAFGCITTLTALTLGPLTLGIIFCGLKECSVCGEKMLAKNSLCSNCGKS